MKITPLLLLTLLVLSAGATFAATNDAPLEEQLKALELPGNQAPAMVSREKLYVVQTRYLPLHFKNEFSLGVAQNLTGDSFLTTRQFELGYRFHFSDRWSLGVAQSYVSNEFTSEAQNLIHNDGIAPNLSYVRQRSELTAGFNTFYGKFRLSADQVFYFDQYVAAGPGLMSLNTGMVGAAVADIGLAFWLGQWGSARVGVKDYLYNETDSNGNSFASNIHAHIDVGYLF